TPEGTALDKQTAQNSLMSHTDTTVKMASASGNATESVRLQRVESLESAMRSSVVRTAEAPAAAASPAAQIIEVAPLLATGARGFSLPVAVQSDAHGVDNHTARAELWTLADSLPTYSALGAADGLDGAATDGAAQGLRAQLSRWSTGFGQRPLTRGALRA
ncbi:hypothetical protein, partial [Hydrogenophaga sp. RWCD_12]|uniref:hypothetical protein n=1 Tax=Hydrogenophaga sp. RWCD_12 TaxID=3391190 RepID=UPI003984EBA5